MTNFLSQLFNFFLNIFFPIKCLGCGYREKWLCERCFYKARAKILAPEHRQINNPLNKIIAPYSYEDPLIRKLVMTYKYNFVRDLKKDLGRLLNEEIKDYFIREKDDSFVLIPVPLHPKRLRWRGFNQSLLLANEVSKRFKIPIRNDIIFRRRNTKPQSLLISKERGKNIREAFSVKREKTLDDKILILVDDVYTTGSTLEECARILRKTSRPRAIWGLTFARG